MNDPKEIPIDAKKVFMQCGTCSQTYFHVLNRAFGYPKEVQERASDPLAGGLMCGQQCGMLWGSTLAVGAEAFRRHADRGQAIAAAITTTRQVVESFSKRAKSVNCRDIIGCDLSNPFGIVKLMLKILLQGGIKNSVCLNLAEAWAPEAIQSAASGLSHLQTDLSQPPISCASEAARKMGAGDDEMVTVAGFAGGMGLSGYGCGALGAAIWMNTLAWYRKHPGETLPFSNNPATTKLLKAFHAAAGSEIRCSKITGQRFQTINEHTEFIKNGRCDMLINVLAREMI